MGGRSCPSTCEESSWGHVLRASGAAGASGFSGGSVVYLDHKGGGASPRERPSLSFSGGSQMKGRKKLQIRRSDSSEAFEGFMLDEFRNRSSRVGGEQRGYADAAGGHGAARRWSLHLRGAGCDGFEERQPSQLVAGVQAAGTHQVWDPSLLFLLRLACWKETHLGFGS